MRMLQGLGGGPVIPMAQATMWEIFPLRQRGTAMAVWGVGIMMAPILGPTLGGWIVDNWSWRWIFYVNLPIGVLGFFMASVFLFDSPFLRKPRRDGRRRPRAHGAGLRRPPAHDRPGREARLVRLRLHRDADDRGRGLLTAFLVARAVDGGADPRPRRVPRPQLRLQRIIIALVGFGFNSSMLLVALYTQKMLGYDAWTSGLVLAPGGLGTMIALMFSGRLVSRVDQRLMLLFGCGLNASPGDDVEPELGMDYWSLAVAALPARVRPGLHLRAAPDAGARHHPAGAAVQRHRGLQRGPEHRRQHRGGPDHHAAGPARQYHQATLAGHLTQWSRRPPPAAAVDRPLRGPGRRLLHGRAAGPEHALPGDDRAGAGPQPTPTSSGSSRWCSWPCCPSCRYSDACAPRRTSGCAPPRRRAGPSRGRPPPTPPGYPSDRLSA